MLTEAQLRVLVALVAYVGEHGWAPSMDEIRVRVGLLSRSSVHRQLELLEHAGAIKRGGGARMLRVTPLGYHLAGKRDLAGGRALAAAVVAGGACADAIACHLHPGYVIKPSLAAALDEWRAATGEHQEAFVEAVKADNLRREMDKPVADTGPVAAFEHVEKRRAE